MVVEDELQLEKGLISAYLYVVNVQNSDVFQENHCKMLDFVHQWDRVRLGIPI